MEQTDDLKTKLISEEGVAVVREGFNREGNIAPLRVSALICTKDRSDMLPNAVESILNASSIIEELIVIDQSTDERSEKSIEQFNTDTRLKYVKDNRVGKGLALNTGLKLAQGDVVAITDDDCMVSKDWPLQLISPFVNNKKVVVTFGTVNAAKYDTTKGFVPIFEITKDMHIKHPWQMIGQPGIGANMAVRKQEFLSFGAFDPELGPGGMFKACIDYDVALRALLFGYEVSKVKESTLVHYGFRDWADSQKLIRNAYYGTGASYIKPIRCGRIGAIPTFLSEFLLHTVFYCIARMVKLQKPIGFMRIVYFIRGSIAGWMQPMDHKTLKYLSERENN